MFILGQCKDGNFQYPIWTGLPRLIHCLWLLPQTQNKARKHWLVLFCVPPRSTIMRVITSPTHRLFNAVMEIWFTCICPLGLSCPRLQSRSKLSCSVPNGFSYLSFRCCTVVLVDCKFLLTDTTCIEYIKREQYFTHSCTGEHIYYLFMRRVIKSKALQVQFEDVSLHAVNLMRWAWDQNLKCVVLCSSDCSDWLDNTICRLVSRLKLKKLLAAVWTQPKGTSHQQLAEGCWSWGRREKFTILVNYPKLTG